MILKKSLYLIANQLIVIIMDFKKSIVRLVIALVLSPIVFYIVYYAAKLAGANYEMTDGEAFIVWLLMGILINLSMADKKA